MSSTRQLSFFMLLLLLKTAHGALVHPAVVPLDGDDGVRRRSSPATSTVNTTLFSSGIFTLPDAVPYRLPRVCTDTHIQPLATVFDDGNLWVIRMLEIYSDLNNSTSVCIVCDNCNETGTFPVNKIMSKLAEGVVFDDAAFAEGVFLWIKNSSFTFDELLDNKETRSFDNATDKFLTETLTCVYIENAATQTLHANCTSRAAPLAAMQAAKLASTYAPVFTVDNADPAPAESELIPSVCATNAIWDSEAEWCFVHGPQPHQQQQSQRAAKQNELCISCNYAADSSGYVIQSSSSRNAFLIRELLTAVEWVELNYLWQLESINVYIVLKNLTELIESAVAVRTTRAGGQFAKSLVHSILLLTNNTAAVVSYPHGLFAPQTHYYNQSRMWEHKNGQNLLQLPASCLMPLDCYSVNEMLPNKACFVHKPHPSATAFCISCDRLQFEKSFVNSDENEFNLFLREPSLLFANIWLNNSELLENIYIVLKPAWRPMDELYEGLSQCFNDNNQRQNSNLPDMMIKVYYFFNNASANVFTFQVANASSRVLAIELLDNAWNPEQPLSPDSVSTQSSVFSTSDRETILMEETLTRTNAESITLMSSVLLEEWQATTTEGFEELD